MKLPLAPASPPLPPGLTLNPDSGVISGTPTAQGTYAFTVRVVDGGTGPLQQTADWPLAINIVSGLTVATSSLPGSTVGAAYSQTLAAAGGISPYIWALTSGSLPPGLNLATGGQITGSPTSAGNFPFTVQVTDSAAGAATRALTIAVAPAPSITTVSLPNATVNVAYSQLLTVTGGTPAFTWAIISGALPSGLTLNAQTGLISGIPIAGGSPSFTVRVSDSVGVAASRALSITVGGALAIVTATLPSGVVGASYSQMLTATGGTPPYSNWMVISSSLPAGLSLSAATGMISGAPLSAGFSSFVVQVSDSASAIATKALSVSVTAGLSITTTSLPGGVVGTAYSQTLAASGGTPPYSWSLASGSLPPGLSLAAGGQITGSPTSADSYSFSVRVTDSAAVPAVKFFSIIVTAGLSITTASLPGGVVGTAYAQALAASGGTPPYTWALASGSLPPGLSLAAGGQITGTPTSSGTVSFTVRVTDSAAATAVAALSITVTAGLAITSPAQFPAGSTGTAYTQTLTATGGTPPYAWAVVSGQLPAGLSLSAAGVLSGTPTAVGTSSFRVQVTDSAGKQAVQDFSLTIATGFVITTASPLPAATVGASYTQTLAAAGGAEPYSDWRVAGGILPAGLSLDSATGRLSGTPTLAGTLAFTVQARDSSGRIASKEFTLTVQTAALVITTASPLPSGMVGRAYSQTLQTTGGLASLTWTLKEGSLPAGLSLDASGGRISGTPTAVAAASFTLEVTDSSRRTASKAFALTIDPPALPAVQFVGPPDTAEPAQQPAVRLTLASGYPLPMTGQMTLTFEPDAIHAADDPAVLFSTGGRTVNFTMAANATQATFPTASLAFQTGTVAGTITLRATFQTAGRNVTPSPAPVKVVRLLRSAPVIRSVQVERTGSGFDVVVKGLSTPRQVTQAAFRFNPAPAANLQTTEITLPMTTLSDRWYQDQGSRQYGSQFTLRQSFTVSGDPRAVSSVSVTLTNSVGSSQAASAGL